MRNNAKQMALGGIFAALAVTIMSLGGMIPLATYVCPVLCMMLQFTVLIFCGKRTAWAWYGAVSILGLLLGPDKEAAAVFCFLGYYPIIKPRLDKMRLGLLWKAMLFNASMCIMYWLLLHLFGLEGLTEEFSELGTAMLWVLLAMGNVTFFLLDKVLILFARKLVGR